MVYKNKNIGKNLLERTATISDCGRYRYLLTRTWGEGSRCLFIMLNPSTADGEQDDNTIRRCVSFAKREGAGSLAVVNLMAYRSTDPDLLPEDDEALGPENRSYLEREMAACDGPIIAAWGSHKAADRYIPLVRDILSGAGREISCLKLSTRGRPYHPLYVKGDSPLLPFTFGS